MHLRILISSGESIGHLNRGLIILKSLERKANFHSAFVLPRNSTFLSYVRKNSYQTFEIGDNKLSLAPFVRNFQSTRSYLKALYDSWLILDDFKPHLLLGTGGRASFPVAFAASLKKTPSITVSNYVMNRTNRFLAYFVNRTCVSSSSIYHSFPKYLHRKLRITGVPLREEAFLRIPLREAKERLSLDANVDVVTFVGYTRGSRMFSDLVREVISRFDSNEENVQFIVQYGKFPLDGIEKGIQSKKVLAKSFFNNILEVFSASDLVVSASGETTLLELCAKGVPSICISIEDIPIDTHVYKLIKVLHKDDATVFIPPSRLSVEDLEKNIRILLRNKGRLRKMTDSASKVSDRYATEKVIDVIEELLQEKRIFYGT